MALTGTTPAAPSAPLPASGPPARDAATVPATVPAAAPVPDVPKPPAPPTASPIGFALHFDNDMQRLILEVREPVTGYVIYQMPPKYVVKQFLASSSGSAPARGAQVDSAI